MKVHAVYLFTDSQCTLNWIASPEQQAPVFIRNRVNKIKTHSDITFVKENPADEACCGCTPEK